MNAHANFQTILVLKFNNEKHINTILDPYFSFDSGNADVSMLYCFVSPTTHSTCISFDAMRMSRATSVGSSCDVHP